MARGKFYKRFHLILLYFNFRIRINLQPSSEDCKKKGKCEEITLTDKEVKSCKKGEENLVSCIAEGTFLLELEQYSFPQDLITEHHKSTEYKKMIDALEEGVKDDVIENYLVSEELNVHMQEMFKEYNESTEVQQLIESTVNESLANETKQLEEKRDDDISKAKETDVKTLDLIEELVLKLHKVYAEESRTYRSERYAKSYLTTRHLNDRILRPPTEEKGDLTATWSRLFTTDRNRYFNWNYERGYTFPNIEGQRIVDSPMNPNWNYGPVQDSPWNPEWDYGPVQESPINPEWNYGPVQNSPMYPEWSYGPVQDSPMNPEWNYGPVQDSPMNPEWNYGPVRRRPDNQDPMHKQQNEETYDNAPGPHWGQETIQKGNAPQYGYAPAPNWGQDTIQKGNAPQYGHAPAPNWGQETIQKGNAPQYGYAPAPQWDKGPKTTEQSYLPTTGFSHGPGVISGNKFWDSPFRWRYSDADSTTVPFFALAPNPFYNDNNNNGGQNENGPRDEGRKTIEPTTAGIVPAANPFYNVNKGRELPPKGKNANKLINSGGITKTEHEEEKAKSFDISRIKEFSGQIEEQPDKDLKENLPEKNSGINIEIKNRVLARFQKARQVTQAPDRGDSPKKTEKMGQIDEPNKEVKSDATTLWIPVSSPYN